MAEKKYNPYDNMLSVLKQSAEALGLSYEDYATLCYPERELKVSIPIRADDRKDTGCITTGQTDQFSSGKFGRIDLDTSFGTAVRNIYNCRFSRT